MCCCLMSSIAPTPTSDHQISSLLTLLVPHSVPSKRGTRSRVQLDLSPGCTWHERTSHMSWCDKKIRKFRKSLRLINTAVPKAAPFKWCMSRTFGFPTATQQCKQVPCISPATGQKLWACQKTITASCNARQ